MTVRGQSKLNDYLYKITYGSPPYREPSSYGLGGCSAYVKDGKLYRNLDWDYSEDISFWVVTPDFEGMAFGSLDDIDSLPYKVVDGVNKHGIKVAVFVLFNDFGWTGTGDIPLYKLPYIALTTMEKISDVYSLPLSELKRVESLGDYIAQYLITDGTTSYGIVPSENGYEIVEANKMTNFKEGQDRPTGLERYEMMPCPLKELRFTKAYETPTRLSEFIGINGTTKDSSEEELLAIYETAHQKYLTRTRNGETWQTLHSVVYGNKLEHLYIQEDWSKDWSVTKMIKSYTGELVIELGEHKRTKARNEFEGTHAEREAMGTSRLNVGDSYFEWDTFGLFFWNGEEWLDGGE